MFIGHYGIAFALKKYDKKSNLGFLFIAVQLVDWALVFFILLGIEHMRIVPGFTESNSYDLYDAPYSHSLLACIIWAVGTYLVVRYLFLKNSDKSEAEKSRTALTLGIAVISHWVLDFLVHTQELLLIPGIDFKVGLGLWNFLFISVALEFVFLLIGSLIYFKSTELESKFAGKYGMFLFIGFLGFLTIMVYFMINPTNVTEAMIYLLLSFIGLSLIAFWLDGKGTYEDKDKL